MKFRDFIEKAITVPFVPMGRKFDGWDCYGLVWRYFWEVRGMVCPSLASKYDDIDNLRHMQRLFRRELNKPRWQRQDNPSDGDVAVIMRRGLPIHCGVVVQEGSQILHTEQKIGTVIEPMHRFRIYGFYRA